MSKLEFFPIAKRRMSIKSTLKMLLDFGMTVVIFVLLSYQYTTQENHEIFGAVMLKAFLLHQAFNIHWYKSLFKGKYTKQRALMLVVDGATLLVMLALMISGTSMSRYVFRFMDVPISAALVREIHMVTSFLSFLLTGFHLGLHASMLYGALCKTLHRPQFRKRFFSVSKVFFPVIVLYGAYATHKREFMKYITLQNHFLQFDYSESVILYLLDLIAIFLFTATLGYLAKRVLSKKQNPIEHKGDSL